MLVLKMERGLREVWTGLQLLPAHRIWEVSTHSMVVLDGAADLLHLPCQGGHSSNPAQQNISGFAWHTMACVAVLVSVLPVQAKDDAPGGQHMKMCPAWY